MITRDFAHAIRSLKRNPTISLLSTFTIAIGIAVACATFSLVDWALLRPLPYPDADRLITVVQQRPSRGTSTSALAPANYVDIGRNCKGLDVVAAYTPVNQALTGVDQPELLNGAAVSASFFELLGLRATLGRTFYQREDTGTGEPVVVISYDLWQRRFTGDHGVIGRVVNLDGRPFQVIGVAEPGREYPKGTDFWIPLSRYAGPLFASRAFPIFQTLARLRRGVPAQRAQAELNLLASRLEMEHPATNSGLRFLAISLRDSLTRQSRYPILILFGAALVLFAISFFNVAGLLFGRALDRRRELAIRRALGADGLAIAKQLLFEGFITAALGGSLGLILIGASTNFLNQILPDNAIRRGYTGTNFSVLALAMLLALLFAVAFAVAQAWQISRDKNLTICLKEGPAAPAGSRDRRRIWDALVVGEVALSMILCVGAGLLLTSFVRLVSVNPGFNPENVLVVGVRLNQPEYADNFRKVAFYQQAMGKIASVPGVRSTGAVTFVPYGGSSSVYNIKGDVEPRTPEALRTARVEVTGGDYFRSLGIRLQAGRTFLPSDSADSAPVAIVNQSAADIYFNGKPLGHKLTLGNNSPEYQVIGVVGDIRDQALDLAPEPEVFLPFEQSPWGQFYFVAKTDTNPMLAAAAVRDAIWSVDRETSIVKISTMDQLLAGSVLDRRLKGAVVSIFGVLALAMSSVGLFSLISYSVRRNIREIGIRTALGAGKREIAVFVAGKGLLLGSIGIVIGTGLSVASARLL